MEALIGYTFKDKELLERALTHSSYANEYRQQGVRHNERLEFLGDAVLELVISSFIFNEFQDYPEGELTKLRASIVCEYMLSHKAMELKLGEHLRLGKGEDATGGRERPSILADAFEAIIGAIYIDGGIECARDFILEQLKDDIFGMKRKFRTNDSKTYLQEIIQSTSKEGVEYAIVSESGPAHNKVFCAEARHKGEVLGKGKGKSKKEAEQNAALAAIEKMNVD